LEGFMGSESIKIKLIDTAISELINGRWEQLTIKVLSTKTKIKVSQINKISSSKEGLLDLWSQNINLKILEKVTLQELGEVNIKERILELMLCRLDVLNEHKKEILALMKLARRNGIESIRAFERIKKSMEYILNLSGAKMAGKKGGLKIIVLSLIWIITLKDWSELEEDDDSSVMSKLDKRLLIAEKLNNSLFV
tara:strand:+ start:104 stop:688 length:585 start_codon:yes stop_codon:yes gene_type:complete